MNRLLCSTGALLGRANGRNHRLLLEIVPQLHADGLEVMFYDSWYNETEALLSSLRSLSLPIPVLHAEKNICLLLLSDDEAQQLEALRRFTVNCSVAKAVGAEIIVFHLWDGRMEWQQVHKAFQCIPMLMEIAQQYALLFTIENIVSMYSDPFTCLKALHELYPALSFTYDTKMAAFHNQERLLFAEKDAAFLSRIAHFHLNDYAGGYMDWQSFRTLHPGEGRVDFVNLRTLIRKMNYTGDFTTEATSFDSTGAIHIDKLNRTLDNLRKLMQQEI